MIRQETQSEKFGRSGKRTTKYKIMDLLRINPKGLYDVDEISAYLTCIGYGTTRHSVQNRLSKMVELGLIKRVLRGIYCYNSSEPI